MSREVYRAFVRALFRNYCIGSVVAVLGVGGSLIFSTLRLNSRDGLLLVVTLLVALVVMATSELWLFTRHLSPIRTVLADGQMALLNYQRAYQQAHRLPLLAVYRIMGPHWLGILVPGAVISVFEIHAGFLSFPYRYVWLATIGSFLVAVMHALVEFFLTTSTIQPILDHMRTFCAEVHGVELSLDGRVIVPIGRKFQLSVIVIGALPLVLFVLANQIRLGQTQSHVPGQYWTWALTVLLIGVAFALYCAQLLSTHVRRPIAGLVSLMQQVQSGRFDVVAEDFLSDEFSRLVAGFNHMVQGLSQREHMNNQLMESYFATLAAALDARDPYTAGHSIRVAEYGVAIARQAGLDNETLSLLRKSALLHDIGKIGVRDEVLLKTGRLTPEEFAAIKQHPVIGESIIQQIQPESAMQDLLPGIRSHHERWDGHGYPDGLVGFEIPLFGRILAVADAYDAMTSDRPYRSGMPREKALQILTEGRGTQWDPVFVDAFIEWHRVLHPVALTTAQQTVIRANNAPL